MSETAPESAPKQSQSPAWMRWGRVILPHIATAIVAIAVSLAAQFWWVPPPQPTVIVPTSPPFTPMPLPTATTAPVSTAPAPAPDIVRQELIDLRAEDDELWAAIYLAKAVSQVSEAENQMRSNDLNSVAQSLVAVDGSLELAYEHANEAVKNPIAELRRYAGTLHDDLYVRPEGMDARLVVLRQTILALMGEQR